MSLWFYFLTQATLIAYALVGGVFLAFSDFIMRSLKHTSGRGGVEAMQVINREVFRWIFMTLFLGLAPVSVALILYSYVSLSGPSALLIAASGAVYLLGCFGVTIVRNVPMNEALARLETGGSEATEYWTSIYLPRWTFWNSVRTLACTISAALLLSGVLWLNSNPVT